MSFDAYLRLSEQADRRYEYMNGFAYGLAGATLDHDTVTLNVATRLRERSRERGCVTTSQGFQVLTPRGDAYLPDAMVACGPRPAGDARYLERPCLIVEVLSRSTLRTDHGEKRMAYQEIPSLGAYLVVETAWRAVHRHWRGTDGEWRSETVAGVGIVPLPCPAGTTLTLEEIYEDVAVPVEPPRASRVYEEAQPAGA